MKVTIHQPEHLIWLGLVKKIADADVFVILDSVQFEKNYFQNRNKIRTKEGWIWLTVPVKKAPLATLIKDIEISYERDWVVKYLRSLQSSYGKAPYFHAYYPKIEKIFLKKYNLLVDLNIELIRFALEEFGIQKTILRSSELGILENIGGSNVCLEICKVMHANVYMAGPSGRDYLVISDFEKANVEVEFHEFSHPVYKQVHGDFLAGMSCIDALFNLGPRAKDIL